MTTCALCPRPAAQHWGTCQPCHERDLIRGARLRWEGAALHRREARMALAGVSHEAVRAALSEETDRDKWAGLFRQVRQQAERAEQLAREANRLHAEAGARALELWQLRGRRGKLALCEGDLPEENPTP